MKIRISLFCKVIVLILQKVSKVIKKGVLSLQGIHKRDIDVRSIENVETA
ncbi:hypothetical protein J6TS2_43650 [Heyndrickxia sporothermodurans]|nr:hypothetical protein J6TS2_43650 [Heyndrickxia sporothermodurans]